ncbi:MAG: hypothetical protein J1E83_14430 [Lachnospiraceae bacterium]|nr:hypothetical protein [Lachnospiraceae bacterium]
MRIGASLSAAAVTEKRNTGVMNRRFTLEGYGDAQKKSNAAWAEAGGNRMEDFAVEKTDDERSEAEKIYQAVSTGGENPARNIRQAAKGPYGYLAKDGMITYNGVTFVCDERTNSICLGDMTDKKNVLNIPLSGGGHLKVHRDNLGDLSKAIGMFSPEDVNRILRAIALDTKLQSMQQELDDMENSVGEAEEALADTQANIQTDTQVDAEDESQTATLAGTWADTQIDRSDDKKDTEK